MARVSQAGCDIGVMGAEGCALRIDRRREFATTTSELIPIPSAAIQGTSTPEKASGTMTAL